eukprot:15475339-Alexandrium_andersonii.AAC.1
MLEPPTLRQVFRPLRLERGVRQGGAWPRGASMRVSRSADGSLSLGPSLSRMPASLLEGPK